MLRTLLALCLAVTGAGAAVLATAPEAVAAGTPDIALAKEMPTESLYGDPIPVTVTATNPSGTDGYNLSFTDVLPSDVTVSDAKPAPDRVLPQTDGTTVLVWDNVADLLSGTTVSVTYDLVADPDVYGISSVVTNSASAYVNSNARLAPSFAATGEVVDGSATGSATAEASTTLIPFRITKAEPSPEAELLRGVHDHKTVYSLTVENNRLLASSGFALVDHLPAGLEFLGCSAVDNTTGADVEYPDAGRIDDTAHPAFTHPCAEPTSVTTVTTDPDGDGPMPDAVYTRVAWSSASLAAALGSSGLAAGGEFTIDYAAAVPLRSNVQADLAEPTANLDNNTGPLTTDEQELRNIAAVTGTTVGDDYADSDIKTVTAEDVAIQKSVVEEKVVQGSSSSWTLNLQTSEYALSTGTFTVIDTLPASLDLTGSTPSTESVTTNDDGTQTLTWVLPAATAPSHSPQITFTTQVRTTYRTVGGPIAANDRWTNRVSVSTPVELLVDGDGTTSTPTIEDESSASQYTAGVTLSKEVSNPVAGAMTCSDSALTFDPDVSSGPYRTGDRVCWRLTVSFPGRLDTVSPVVRDFLPAGFLYEGFDFTSSNSIDEGGVVFSAADEPVLRWTLPDAGPGQTFQVVVSSRIDAPDAAASGDILSNLLKFGYQNTAGDQFQLRDKADAPYVEPQLTLAKSASATTANGGADVTYTLDVVNGGGLQADDVSVRDLLPTGVSCTDVVDLGGAACTPASGDAPAHLQWDGLTVPADDQISLDYTVTIPASFAPGTQLTNTAGVRSYTNATNSGVESTLVPSDNIDPDLTPNTGPARDDAVVRVAAAGLTKTRTTGVDEAGNTAADEATVGEIVTYTVEATVPGGTTLTDGVVRDALPAGLTLVGTPTYTLDGAALPGTFQAGAVDDVITVQFPTPYTTADDADEVVGITFTARVTDVASNLRGEVVVNSATFGWDGGSTQKTVDTTVVEPDLSVTKASDDPDGDVGPGQPVTYTVTVRNGAGTDVSTAHDLTVTDVVPASVAPLDTNGDPAADGASVGSGGVWDADTRTITWQVMSLAPGASSVLAYDTTIADPIIGGSSIRNTVTAVGSSLGGNVTGERTAASGYPGYEARDSVELHGPVFSVAKSASPGAATIGEPVTYTVDVTIPSGVEGHDVTVLDALPAGIAFDRLVAVTCAGCSPDVSATALSQRGDTGTVGFFLGDLTSSAVERLVRLTYLAYPDGTVRENPADNSDRVTNTARLHFNATDKITGTPPAPPAADDFDGSSDPSSATVEIDEPRLVLDKSVDGQVDDADARRATPGTTLTYTVIVRNTGTSSAYDVVVGDAPDGRLVDYVDATDLTQAGGITPVDADPSDGSLRWTVAGPVAPGSSVTVSYRLTVPTTLDETDEVLGGPEVSNTVRVPAYFGLPAAERDQPGRSYPQYQDVVPDTVDVELDLASIGDLVWHDVNGDGVKDDDEPVLPGVRVTVTYLGPDGRPGGGDDEPHVATTGSDGTYVVDHLPGGQYSVVVDPTSAPLVDQGLSPAYDLDGGTTTANGSWQGELAGDAAKRDVDFGYRGTGRIGDTVYVDQDLSGAQDGTEPGIPAVGVTLVWAGPDNDPDTAGDNLTWTTTTDAAGRYDFPNLPVGDFQVTVDTSTLDASYRNVDDPDGGGDSTSSVTLGTGGQDLDQDFGYAGTGAVGDTVYLDRNGNGTQDAGEPGLSGVTVAVTLDGANGETATFTTTTDTNGGYLVDNLPAGDYTVEVRTGLPAGVANTGDPDGGGDSTSALILGAGDRDLDQDFGYRARSVLGDRVWLDLDADGVQEAGEPGIPGVAVRAEGPNGTVFDTTTGPDGRYSFVDIPNGAYTVTVLSGLPGGVSATYDAAGTPDGVSTTVLDGSDLDQDFGYRGSASLGDVVWLDRDGNGGGALGAGEPGLPGVRVSATHPGPDGDPSTTADNITVTTTTDADGRYLFEHLPAGRYTVAVDTTTLPEGVVATHDLDGANDSTSVVDLAAGEARRDVDFGYRGTAAIGDTVWWDRDGDGRQDTAGAGAEPGLAGVAVNVTWAGADGDLTTTDDNETFTAITDADGRYLVDGLPAGTYDVRVDTTTVPPGMVATYDEDGGLDSSSEVSLSAGEEHRGADFGYRGSGTVGDAVYLDLDGDGSQGPGEPGVPGQRVDLIWAGPDGDLGTDDDLVLTTTTGPDGGVPLHRPAGRRRPGPGRRWGGRRRRQLRRPRRRDGLTVGPHPRNRDDRPRPGLRLSRSQRRRRHHLVGPERQRRRRRSRDRAAPPGGHDPSHVVRPGR